MIVGRPYFSDNFSCEFSLFVQVEYRPSAVSSNCTGLFKEIMEGIIGKTVDIPNYIKLRGNELYTPNDTMKQYLEHFNMLKKAQMMPQQH